jgi:hypothetical protein
MKRLRRLASYKISLEKYEARFARTLRELKQEGILIAHGELKTLLQLEILLKEFLIENK